MENSEAKRHLNGTLLVKRNTLPLNLVLLFTESSQPTIFSFLRHILMTISFLSQTHGLKYKQNKIFRPQCKSFILQGPKLKKNRFWRKEF